MIHASYDPKLPSRGDKRANYVTRKLCATRDMIWNRFLGVIILPAIIHASYDPRNL